MSDCVSANLKSFRETLAGMFPFSNHNGCLPHTGSHVGENLQTPNLDEFMIIYNAIVGTSNYAVVLFCEITGHTAKKRSETRWFSVNDVQELSLLPNALNGKLLIWADKLIAHGLCDKNAPKLRQFLLNPTKLKLFKLELLVAVHIGKGLKARTTKLEGDSFEIITGYDTILHMGEAMKDPITPELSKELDNLAKDLASTPAPLFAPAPREHAQPTEPEPTEPNVVDILASLSPAVFKTVNVSTDAQLWEWSGTPTQPRFAGKVTSWFKAPGQAEKGEEMIRIKWELGRDDNGEPQLDATGKPKYHATKEWRISKLLEHGFRLEAFDDGSPAPTLAPPSVQTDPSEQAAQQESDTHLLASNNLNDTKVLHARARAVVSPAKAYYDAKMLGKRDGQLQCMKAVRFFNPLFVLGSGEVTEQTIDGLAVLRLSKHKKVAPQIEVCCPKHLPTHSLHTISCLSMPRRVCCAANAC